VIERSCVLSNDADDDVAIGDDAARNQSIEMSLDDHEVPDMFLAHDASSRSNRFVRSDRAHFAVTNFVDLHDRSVTQRAGHRVVNCERSEEVSDG
jgi:hypothetical protein